MVWIFHLDAKNEENSENLTRPALKFTRSCERVSGILHPCFNVLPLCLQVFKMDFNPCPAETECTMPLQTV